MGCGKSLAAIAVTGALYNSGKIKKALIVGPLSMVGVWQEEFQKFADFDYVAVPLEGSSEKKVETLRRMVGTQLQVVIMNYESAWRLEKELLYWDADMVIADEGHKIKTHNIAASKSMHKIGAKTRYRLLLTGTLITNKALDVFSQYKFLNPSIFGPSFYSFRSRYFHMTGFGNHTPVLKKSMESDLINRIHSIAYRITKAECLDLPETIDMVRTVELEPAAARIYKGLVKDSFAELQKGEVTVTNILTRLLRLSQLTGGFIGDDEGHAPQKISTAKMTALEDILDEALNENKKLVVIARFVPEIKAICQLLESKKVGYSLIMGGIQNRDVQVARFQNNPAVQLFVGQIATAGLGITLTAASTMVFYSMDYSMSNFEQTKARIHRVGQKYPCTYLYLTAAGTIDEKVLKVLQKKADLAKTLIDEYQRGMNPYITEGGEIHGTKNV
jgi:SNF2 family DNA or RNA helicase